MSNGIDDVISALIPRMRELGVVAVYLFGSAARGQMTAESDVDVIAKFRDDDAEHYFEVLFLLEDALGRSVDLALPETLHPRIRDRVLSEAKRVA
jgi:predicted nucleotidyltransferase